VIRIGSSTHRETKKIVGKGDFPLLYSKDCYCSLGNILPKFQTLLQHGGLYSDEKSQKTESS
jgi:hypothetical protein